MVQPATTSLVFIINISCVTSHKYITRTCSLTVDQGLYISNFFLVCKDDTAREKCHYNVQCTKSSDCARFPCISIHVYTNIKMFV